MIGCGERIRLFSLNSICPTYSSTGYKGFENPNRKKSANYYFCVLHAGCIYALGIELSNSLISGDAPSKKIEIF